MKTTPEKNKKDGAGINYHFYDNFPEGISVLSSKKELLYRNKASEKIIDDNVLNDFFSSQKDLPVNFSLNGIEGTCYPFKDGRSKNYMIIFRKNITPKSKTQNELEEIEYRNYLKELLGDNTVNLYRYNHVSGKYDYIGKLIEDLTGIPPEEFKKHGLNKTLSYLHPDDRNHLIQKYQSIAKKNAGKKVSLKVKYRWKNTYGHYRIIFDHITISVSNEGTIETITGAGIDMTDQEEQSIYRKKEEITIREALEATVDGIWERHLDSGDSYYSENWYKMLGYRASDFADSKRIFWELLHPEDYDTVVKSLDKHIYGNSEIYKAEFRLKCKDGSWKWILSKGKVLSRDDAGKPIRLVGSHIDIDEAKNKEHGFLKDIGLLRNLIYLNIDGFALINDKGRIYDWNPALERITGLTRSEVLNKNIWNVQSDLTDSKDFSSKQYKATVLEWFRKAEVDPEFIKQDLTIVRADGSIRFIRIFFMMLDNGHDKYLAAQVKDITGDKLLDDEIEDQLVRGNSDSANAENLVLSHNINDADDLRQAIRQLKNYEEVLKQRSGEINEINKKREESEKELKKLLVSKDKIFSIIAHDLKSPFQGFLSLTKYLNENLETLDMDEARSLTSQMYNSSKHLYDMIENLLQWSRIQRGTIVYNPEEFAISSMLVLNIDILLSQALNKKITINNNCSAGTLVFADVNLLNIIVRNILTNAIKFTNYGGKIELSCKKSAKGFVCLEIEDNGIGIDPETLKHLFDVKTHTSTAGTANETGTGLGMIICRELAEKNGGSIQVSSVPGRGTKVALIIPCKN
ncbi:MAG: PAS domain-containing protein [Candidatus Kapaibacterium sp.]